MGRSVVHLYKETPPHLGNQLGLLSPRPHNSKKCVTPTLMLTQQHAGSSARASNLMRTALTVGVLPTHMPRKRLPQMHRFATLRI